MSSNLSSTELLKEATSKRANRVITFLRKYEKEEDFELVSGGKKVKLVVTAGTVAALKKASEAVGPSPSQGIKDLLDELHFLPSEPGVTEGRRKAAPDSYRLKDFAKTAEFGGKGGAVGTASPTKEAVHGLLARMHHLDTRYKLNSPAASERGELMVLQDINQYILNLETPINVNVGNEVYKNIYGANKVPGTPKADITLVTFNEKTKKFEDVYFLSHKLGTDASGFQGYSGVSERADGFGVDADSGAPPAISQHKEVVAFLKKIVKRYKDIATPKGTVGKRFYAVIKDDELIGKAVYGPKFSGQEKHADNVNMIAQGNPTLRPLGSGEHALSFSAVATSFSKDISHFKKDDGYRAVLGARPGPSRSFSYLNKRYPGVRVGIFPRKMLGILAKPI